MSIVNTTVTLDIIPFPSPLTTLSGANVHPKFSGVDVKFSDFTVVFFRSGKANVVGYKDPSDLTHLEDKVSEYLSSNGIVKTAVKASLVNMVLNGTVGEREGCRVNLPKLFGDFKSRGYRVSYEPETYAGLVLRPAEKPMKGKGKCFILFPNGHLTLTGVRDKDDGMDELLGMMLELEMLCSE